MIDVKVFNGGNSQNFTRRYGDAGYDIYPYSTTDEKIIINPQETILIPTSIKTIFSPDYVAILKERGSMGAKGLGLRAGVIDSSYRGEWFVAITNHNNEPATIPMDKAICQVVFERVNELNIISVSEDEITKDKTERGDGRLGSSGK